MSARIAASIVPRARPRSRASTRASRRRGDAATRHRVRAHAAETSQRGRAPPTGENHRVGSRSVAGSRSASRSFDDDVSSSGSFDEGARVVKARPLRLLTSYVDVVEALCRELGTTSKGDSVEFSVYVFERGKSSDKVVAAMKRAVKRGVRVKCSVDGSVVSKFTRWCEGTTTLTAELEALQEELGAEHFSFTPVSQATHAKFMIVERKHGTGLPSVIFGGVNVGDRFTNWRDFAIRADGRAAVDAMRYALGSFERTITSNDDADIVFASNLPTGWSPIAWTFPRYMTFPGRFEVKQAMEQLLRDTRYSKYSVAMAYIDSMGADMLAEMLRRRDASLTLIVPRTPNVYHDANRKALKRLVDVNASRRSGDSNNLKIFLIDDMLHAKVLYAESEDESVADFGMLGSCNLKQRSLGQFVELNASIRQPALTMALRRQLVQLVEESLPLTEEDLVFSEPKATIEEWLG